MQLEVQWFVSLLIDNALLTKEDAMEMNKRLGGSPDLMTFAQEILNKFTAGLSQADAEAWVQQLQTVMEYAQTQAATGAVPPHFEGEETPVIECSASELDAVLEPLDQLAAMDNAQTALFMQTFLNTLREFGASDLHLSSNAPIFVRKHKEIIRLRADRVLTDEECRKMNFSVMTEEQQKTFQESQDMNYALEVGTARFRVALMFHKEGMSGCYRIVPDKIRPLEELGFLPEDAVTIKRLLDYHNGLIIVTGPVGSGKTTTLASMVEVANENRQDHIIMVEDPIEIVIPSKGCQVTQRQIGQSTKSYRTALKGALREDPDIIVIGELHDLETIENAITAAETGHLVIGTLHTCDAANTLNRLLDVFPPSQQPQIRAMTAGSLRGVICQKLMPTVSGKLTVAYEILINTLAISNLIQEGKIYQLSATMQIGSKSGMCTIDQNLFEQYKRGILGDETALSNVKNRAVMEMLKKEVAIAKAKEFAEAKKKKK